MIFRIKVILHFHLPSHFIDLRNNSFSELGIKILVELSNSKNLNQESNNI